MTGNTQDGFAKGRAKAFQQIRDMISMDLDKMAFTAVNDQMGMGQQPDPKEIARVKAGLESLNNYCVAVLDSLEAGETVQSLTGATEIRTYKNITGGDELAGIHSAAEDMKIMLMSMNLDEVAKPFFSEKKRDDENSQFANTYRGATIPKDPYLEYGLALVYETMLGRIEEKIVMKTPAPKVLGLDGAAPEAGKSSLLSTAFRKIAEQEHHSGRLMRRSSKVPNLWPPLKNGMEMPGLGNILRGGVDVLPEPDQTPNDNEEFTEGYTDALRLLFQDMQESHFRAASGQRNYAQKIGLGPSWEDIVASTAKDLFNELRNDMQERIHNNDARGIGDNYADGFNAARDWVKYKISALEVKQNWERSPNTEQAAGKLRSFWMNQADSIINSVMQPEEKPAQPKRPAPKPKTPAL